MCLGEGLQLVIPMKDDCPSSSLCGMRGTKLGHVAVSLSICLTPLVDGIGGR